MHKLFPSHPWARYSKKLTERVEKPLYKGFHIETSAKNRGMRLAQGSAGSTLDGSLICLYFLVDETDGVIADARFQAFGPSALIGAADAMCELVMRKNYDQARRISADLLDKHLRDRKGQQAFPEETFSLINLLLSAIDQVADQCMDIPLSDAYVAPPIADQDVSTMEIREYPGWDLLNEKQQVHIIEEVIATDIRPYIELDAGGIEIISFRNNRELTIAYKGACTSCHSATGSTLTAIQQILRAKVHPQIIVTPDLSLLQGHTAG
jgi:NifU-like protein